MVLSPSATIRSLLLQALPDAAVLLVVSIFAATFLALVVVDFAFATCGLVNLAAVGRGRGAGRVFVPRAVAVRTRFDVV